MFFNKRLKKSTKESEEKFAEMMTEEKVDLKDKFAMIISAFLVIVLPCILILLVISALILLLLGGF